MPAEEIFGFDNSLNDPSKVQIFRCENEIIDAFGYRYVTRDVFSTNPIQTDKGELRIDCDIESDEKWIIYLNDEVVFEMKREDICNEVYNNIKNMNKDDYTQYEMSYLYTSKKIDLKVVFNYLEYVEGKYCYSNYALLMNINDYKD